MSYRRKIQMIDDDLSRLSPSKTALVCKLLKFPPEIWMTLLVETKKCLLNEEKQQQQ
jgi:hypothetical protein